VSFVAGGLAAIALVLVLIAVTLSYRTVLQNDLHHRLEAAAAMIAKVRSADAAKPLVPGLALEGVATRIQGPNLALASPKPGAPLAPPIKFGKTTTSSGSLLSATETLSDGSEVTFTVSQSSITRSIDRLLDIEIPIGLAALIAIGLLVSMATRSALRPLDEVVATARAIGSGDTTRRVHPDRCDTELGTVAAALDSMVDSLDAALRDEVNARETMSRFLADAAHELRTPIASLQATAERLLREQPVRPERDHLEASLAAQTSALGRLVGDLLCLAALEGSVRPATQVVDLASVAEPVVAAVNLRDHTTRIRVDSEPVLIQADPAGVQRIVRNLLDNAVNATPGGNVLITITQDADLAVLHVRDDGPGIPEGEEERIFERFARSAPTNSIGTGLGLAIALRIAHQNGGELTCDPVPSGASFTLRVPVVQKASACYST
jgi:signal transduction histidine kinase